MFLRRSPAPVHSDRHHYSLGFAVPIHGHDIKNKKCVNIWSGVLLRKKSNFAQLSPVSAQHYDASSIENSQGAAHGDNVHPHYNVVAPHATIDDEADHSGNQITLFLSLSVTLLSLPWLTSHPAGLVIPAALLLLPVPGAALRPAVGEGLMLLFGGIKWLLLNRSTGQQEAGKPSTHATSQHSSHPVSGLHANGGYNRDASHKHNTAPAHHHQGNHLYSNKYTHTHMPTHTSALETPHYHPQNIGSSSPAPRGTTRVSTDSDWVPVSPSPSSSIYSRQIHPQTTSHVYNNHASVEMDAPSDRGQPRIVDFDGRTQLRNTDRIMQQPHSVYQDSHSKPDIIEHRGFDGHLLNADLEVAVPPHAWQSNVTDHQPHQLQQNLPSNAFSGGSHSYSEKRAFSKVVPVSSFLTSPESSLVVTGLLKVAPWMKSWGGFE